MIHNNKVYANADEKFVKGTIVYANNYSLYWDEACTVEVKAKDVFDLFLNEVIIKDGIYYVKPYFCSPGLGRLSYYNPNSGSVKEYEASLS